MTLTMTIVAPWGMWQCSDHRVMHLRRKRNRQWAVVRTDDYSPKHIQLMCVGGSALLTYSGLGMIGNNHLSDWLRRLVRGPIRTLDETLIRIQEEATATLAGAAAKAEVIHAFTIGAILQGHPWAVVITNLGWPPGSPPLDRFETDMQTTDEPKALFFGAGRDAVSAEDWALVKRVAARRPRRPEDYSKLLAYVHRRAKHSKHPARHTISEACTTSYMPPTGFGVRTMTHWSQPDPSGKRLPPSPVVFSGIDVTEVMKVLSEHLQTIEGGHPVDDAEYQFRIDEAGGYSVEPPDP